MKLGQIAEWDRDGDIVLWRLSIDWHQGIWILVLSDVAVRATRFMD